MCRCRVKAKAAPVFATQSLLPTGGADNLFKKRGNQSWWEASERIGT